MLYQFNILFKYYSNRIHSRKESSFRISLYLLIFNLIIRKIQLDRSIRPMIIF